jgi:hypothetical protein
LLARDLVAPDAAPSGAGYAIVADMRRLRDDCTRTPRFNADNT